MSDNFVIDPDQLPFPLHHKAIRSSSFRGTNTLASRYSCPNSRSQPAGRVEPQLNGLVGGIEPDLNGFFNQKPSATTAGRVAKYPKGKPQLNGFYGKIAGKHIRGIPQLNQLKEGFESDLNYFFPSEANTRQYANPLPFRDREAAGGLGPKGRVEPQLNGFYGKIPGNRPKGKPHLNVSEGGIEPDLNYFFPTKANTHQYATPLPFRDREAAKELSPKGRVEPQLNGFCSMLGNASKVGVELESNCSRITVNLRFPQVIHSPKLPPPNPETSIKIDHQNIFIGFGGGAVGGGAR